MTSSLSSNSFGELIAAASEGSNSALLQLLAECAPHVYATVRRHLPRSARCRFDSDDVAQQVWASFFANSGNLRRFENQGELIAFLAQMARNKLVDNARHELRQRRDQRRTVPLDSELRGQLAASQPRPSQALATRELAAQVLQDRSDRERTILELRALGYSHSEIAAELSLHPGSVRRILAQCVAQMQQASED